MKIRIILLPIVILLLAIAGCGEKFDNSSSTTGTAGTTGTTSTTTSTGAGYDTAEYDSATYE